MAKRGGFPGGMPGNMNNIMKQAQKMQKQMEEATKELQEKEVTSSAGGGVVEVTVSGNREVTKVKIDPEAVDPDDVGSDHGSNQRGASPDRGDFCTVHVKDYRRTWRNGRRLPVLSR